MAYGNGMNRKPVNKKPMTSGTKNSNSNKLTDKQMEKLKEHSKMHKGGMKSKHMKNMKRFMETKNEKGKFHSFSEAHRKAVQLDKK